MRAKVLVYALASFLVGAAAMMGLAGARGPDPDAIPTSAEAQDRIMSPFCPGLTVSECPSRESASLRRTVNAMVASGRTNREIDAWVVANYGEAALGRPRSLIAWIVPAAAVLGGLAIVLGRLTGRRPPATEPPGEPMDPISPELQDRLAQELRSFSGDTRR